MKCYRYKYDDTSRHTCSGSFDQCKELVECPNDVKQSRPVCFALARLADDDYFGDYPGNISNTRHDSSREGPKMTISHAGCYLHDSVQNVCSSNQCLGNYRASAKNYYCCCTETGCNGELIPKQLPPTLNDSQAASQLQHPPPTPTGPQEAIPLVSQSVICLTVVILFMITVLLGVCYRKRTRQKRIASGNNRAGDLHHSFGSRSANKSENHAGPDGSILIPFRNSFNEDGGANQLYGQGLTGQADANQVGNQADRSNLDNSNNPVNSLVYQQQDQRFDLNDIKLLELVGSGRFGTVHRANLVKRAKKDNGDNSRPRNNQRLMEDFGRVGGDASHQAEHKDAVEENQHQLIDSEIAVKIIPNNELQSWQNELKIYNSTRTRHPNILTFLGSCESPQTNSNWLLVEYAPNGSLHHYLKENPISWKEFLSISLGIVRGLSHLHDADIAHRDFKSKNVLLRRDLSPCITDFGVASMLSLTSGSQNEQRKKYLQVGTPRYMAPEVLECSVAFTKISFTKIDVYALSLVLWELLSRCHPLPKLRMNDYDDNLMSMSLTRSMSTAEPFMMPPPLEFRQPATSTPQKRAAQDSRSMAAQPEQHPAEPVAGRPDSGGLFNLINMDCVDAAHHSQQYELQRLIEARKHEVPAYKVPFEDVVGPNPDINAMRQVVVSDKIRPPIWPEWLFYPIAKLTQAIVDGWEYDHDARISASCFVERIETIMQQQEQEADDEEDEEDEDEDGESDKRSQGQSGRQIVVSQPDALEATTTTTMTTPMIATTVT